MKLPNLIGKTVDEGIAILERHYATLNITLSEYSIPEDFRRKQAPLRDTGVRRILGYRFSNDAQLELIVAIFHENPHPVLPLGADD